MKLFPTKSIELFIADIASIVDLAKEAIEDQLDQEKEEVAALDIASEGLENNLFYIMYISVYFSLSQSLKAIRLLAYPLVVSFASLFYLGNQKLSWGSFGKTSLNPTTLKLHGLIKEGTFLLDDSCRSGP